MTVPAGSVRIVAHDEEGSDRRFFFELGRLFASIVDRLDRIEQKVDSLMAQADDLRAALTDLTAAAGNIADAVANEATQIGAKLDELVAAVGNQVTEADVASVRGNVDALNAAADAIRNLVPDAPPVDPNA